MEHVGTDTNGNQCFITPNGDILTAKLTKRAAPTALGAPTAMATANPLANPSVGRILMSSMSYKPKTIVFEATAGLGVTKIFVDNSLGLFNALGLVDGFSQEMDVKGSVPVSAWKEALKTHAAIIGTINYEGSTAGQLTNDIVIANATVDKHTSTEPNDVAIELRNTAQNDKLQTLQKFPFVWDNWRGIIIDTVAGVTTTLALQIVDWVPYGQLEDYLKKNPYVIPNN